MKISKRKDGYYYTSLYFGTDAVTGKRIRKTVVAKTKTECREKANRLLKDQDKIIKTSQAPKIGLREFSTVWLKDFTGSFRKRSREQAESHIRVHIIPYFGDAELTKITPVQVQAFVNQITEKRSPKTVANVYETFRQIMDTAVSIRYLPESPCQGISLPKKVKPDLNPLDERQINEFMNACPPDVYGDLCRLDVLTGLRMSEIIGLTWDHVNLDRQELLIDRTIPETEKEVVFQPTKNGKSRIVPLPEPAVRILRERRIKQNEDRLRNGPFWTETGLVFTTDVGTKIQPKTLRTHFQAICDACGFQHVRFHDLRHSYAVMSIKAGVDYKSLSDSLGHYSVAFTMDVYAFVSDGMRKAQAEKINSFLQNSYNAK